MELTQRGLVNRRLRLSDAEITTKYVFPFWGRDWKVAFHLVDRFGKGPAVLDPAIHEDADRRLSASAPSSDLRDLGTIEPGVFKALHHYDPWRVFRGIGGVSDALKQAIRPTNIAQAFRHDRRHWKVHDIVLAPDGAAVLAIVAKDEVFRRRDFTSADLDLASTWPVK